MSKPAGLNLFICRITNDISILRCDTIALDGTTNTSTRSTYTHAQKMRASITYAFSRLVGLGSQPWQSSVGSDGKIAFSGNPSGSELVSRYMVSLHRRKAQSGETPTSARAVTWVIGKHYCSTSTPQNTMKRLYLFNHQSEKWDLRPYQPGTRKGKHEVQHEWGGPMARRAAQAIYCIAFLCLLRVDEVLKIRVEHLEVDGNKVTLTLPFRKTHQFGGWSCC
ncbi:hypothetical protein CPB83DRAFT_761480 [Crepidotus variabilis]|uniref:Uncharacterized protein n=1 Tax=Crepidotus variabilis TaxID=179855 RepID=A0A9P6ELX3_9AGAR|nr:hypothetical protein CPB83DRAFT_761480 [Crepidotus variabilis]